MNHLGAAVEVAKLAVLLPIVFAVATYLVVMGAIEQSQPDNWTEL